MERIQMKLEVYKHEISSNLNAAMAEKVRLEEQVDVNNTNIQRMIGALEGIKRSQDAVEEIRKADEDMLEPEKRDAIADLRRDVDTLSAKFTENTPQGD